MTIIGHSRGGVFARALATRRPQLAAGVVTLGSPVLSQPAVHPLVAGSTCSTTAA
jgi:pimeloyl-ACP methyl ester carboxylesterase